MRYWFQKSGPSQTPDKVRTWKDLAGWNDGMFSDISRGGQNFKADKLRWIDTFAGQLECSPHQRDRVEWMLDRIDMAPFQGARIPVENVILGLLSLAIDRDARAFENRAIERDDMQSLMVDLGMERTDLVQIRKLLHKNEREVIKSTGEDRVR